MNWQETQTHISIIVSYKPVAIEIYEQLVRIKQNDATSDIHLLRPIIKSEYTISKSAKSTEIEIKKKIPEIWGYLQQKMYSGDALTTNSTVTPLVDTLKPRQPYTIK